MEAILKPHELARLWFRDNLVLPAMLCCLDNVVLPGVAGTLVYVFGTPSGAESRLVRSFASFSMINRGGRCARRFATDGRRLLRRKFKGEGGAVCRGELSWLLLSSSPGWPK